MSKIIRVNSQFNLKLNFQKNKQLRADQAKALRAFAGSKHPFGCLEPELRTKRMSALCSSQATAPTLCGCGCSGKNRRARCLPAWQTACLRSCAQEMENHLEKRNSLKTKIDFFVFVYRAYKVLFFLVYFQENLKEKMG